MNHGFLCRGKVWLPLPILIKKHRSLSKDIVDSELN